MKSKKGSTKGGLMKEDSMKPGMEGGKGMPYGKGMPGKGKGKGGKRGC